MGLGAQQAGETTTTTNATSEPWKPIQPYLQNIYAKAQGLMDNNPLKAYEGQTISNLQPDTMNALNSMRNYASQGGSPVNQSNAGFLNNLLQQNPNDFTYNPINADEILPGGKLFNANFNAAQNQILPKVQSQFGALGGAQNSGLSSELMKQLSDAFAGQAMNAYAMQQQGGQQNVQNKLNAQGNQLRASSMTPMLDQSAYANLGALSDIGNVFQNQQQQQLDAARNKFDFNQLAPYQQLQMIAGLITGANPNTPTQTGTQSQPYYENPMASMLGLGMSGLNIASKFGAFGPAGAMASGLFG